MQALNATKPLAVKKISRVFFKLCSMNFRVLLMYRASFVFSFLIMTAWIVSFVILVFVIFEHTETLGGFRRGEVLLILSFYYLFQSVSDIFYKENFEDFGANVRRGLFDLRLVKPLPTQFFTFFYTMRFDHIAGFILTIILFVFSFQKLEAPLELHLFLLGILLAFVSSFLYYSILLMVATLVFWISKNDTIANLMWHMSQISRYPRTIYGNVFQKIFTFGLPLALLAAIPAEVATHLADLSLVLFFLVISLVFFIIANAFWKIGIKRYTSSG